MLLLVSTTTLPGRFESDSASMKCLLVAGKSNRSDQRKVGLSARTGLHPMARSQFSMGSTSTFQCSGSRAGAPAASYNLSQDLHQQRPPLGFAHAPGSTPTRG